jgi:hypothetical protein
MNPKIHYRVHKEPATETYPEPVQSSPHPHILFSWGDAKFVIWNFLSI